MRRGRLLILLGVILGLATAVIVLVVLTRQGPWPCNLSRVVGTL
jgi:hypothetical protein